MTETTSRKSSAPEVAEKSTPKGQASTKKPFAKRKRAEKQKRGEESQELKAKMETRAKDRELHGYKLSMNGEQMLEVGQKLLESRDFVFISVDLEMWELDCNFITEIGISVLDMTTQKQCWTPNIETWHLIPTEASKRYNGRRIAEKRNFFTQGKSMVMSLAQCRQFWSGLVNSLKLKSKNVFYVGQGVKEDLFCLSKNDFPLDKTIPVLDTCLIWESRCSLPCSLGNMLKHLNIHHAFLHNAGNDAYYTLRLLLMILDQSVRDRYQLDVGPNRRESDQLAREERAESKKAQNKRGKSTAAESTEVESNEGGDSSPDSNAHPDIDHKLDPAARKKALEQKKRERSKRRLQETKEDMPGQHIFVKFDELESILAKICGENAPGGSSSPA